MYPLVLILALPAWGQLTDGEKKCVKAINTAAFKLEKAQAKEVAQCIKQAGKGKEPFPQICAQIDDRGKVAKALARVERIAERNCEEGASFGAATAAEMEEGILPESLALAADLFGSNLNLAVVEKADDSTAARCQELIFKGAQKLVQGMGKQYLLCLKPGLGKRAEEPLREVADMVACLDAVIDDEQGRIVKQVVKLERTLVKKCEGVGSDWAFPGVCSDAADFAQCVFEQATCRLCRVAQAAGSYAADCDIYDDGLTNISCP